MNLVALEEADRKVITFTAAPHEAGSHQNQRVPASTGHHNGRRPAKHLPTQPIRPLSRLSAAVQIAAIGCGAAVRESFSGDATHQLVLTHIAQERFNGAQIVMVAAGGFHSVALGTDGRVWTWGLNNDGQLGHNDTQGRRAPRQLAGEMLAKSAVVLVAAGYFQEIETTFFTLSMCWKVHTDEVSTQPASVVSINY